LEEKMKFKNIVLSFSIISGLFGANVKAGTACYIYVQGNCVQSWVPTNKWFADDYNQSSSISGRCVHRAEEYARYCGLGNYGDQVNAALNIDSVGTVNAQVFKPGVNGGAPSLSNY
jgi:hypothetical protein